MSCLGSTSTKCTNQRLNSSIATKTAYHQGTQEVYNVESSDDERLLVASPPSLQTVVHTYVLLRCGIKMLLWKHGVLLDIKTDFEQCWEGVGEVANTECTDQTRDISNVGDGCGDNIGNSPVNWYNKDPHDLATLGC